MTHEEELYDVIDFHDGWIKNIGKTSKNNENNINLNPQIINKDTIEYTFLKIICKESILKSFLSKIYKWI